MGLCKCPVKKTVTNQFCFEHRVNVCETCMIADHQKCVVKSYLLWLEDSDYDPNCHFCKTELAEGDCIRLICYHLFHWDCLNKYAASLPAHTAPAGYTCPICSVGIFPPSNMASPIAEILRNTLLGVNWARCGLAFPLVDENPVSAAIPAVVRESSPRKTISQANDHIQKAMEISRHYANAARTHNSEVSHSSSRPEPYGAAFTSGQFTSSRKMYDTTDQNSLLRGTVIDHDDDKYKRRSALELCSRWFRSQSLSSRNRRKDAGSLYKRWMVAGMLALIALCTVILFFLRFGRSSADSDPLLDPHLNPNIRVEDIVQESAKALDNGNIHPVQDGQEHLLPR